MLPILAPMCRWRSRPQHQRRRHAPQPRYLYSITLSARASKVGAIVRPSALAVLRLMTSSNWVGCSIGGAPELIKTIRPIRHQPASFNLLTCTVQRGQTFGESHRIKADSIAVHERA